MNRNEVDRVKKMYEILRTYRQQGWDTKNLENVYRERMDKILAEMKQKNEPTDAIETIYKTMFSSLEENIGHQQQDQEKFKQKQRQATEIKTEVSKSDMVLSAAPRTLKQMIRLKDIEMTRERGDDWSIKAEQYSRDFGIAISTQTKPEHRVRIISHGRARRTIAKNQKTIHSFRMDGNLLNMSAISYLSLLDGRATAAAKRGLELNQRMSSLEFNRATEATEPHPSIVSSLQASVL